MKTVTGKVLSISLNTPVAKKAGGTYAAWQLVYQGSDGKVSTIAKPVQGLGFAPQLKLALESLVVGDDITIEMNKPGEYWEVASITKGTNIPVNTAPDAQEGLPAKQWKSDKTNTYETPEERATRREIDVKRQRLIVRQSSLDQARQIAGPDAKLPAIFKLAKSIEEYVYEGVSLPNDVNTTQPAEVN